MVERFRISINGTDRELSCPPDRSLSQVLRSDLGLTGTKVGCGTGSCGSCTVLMGTRPVRSCKVAIGDVDGPITTIEGLEVDGKLHQIMSSIHEACSKYGTDPDGYIDYVKGANIAGFIKVADAMMDLGVV